MVQYEEIVASILKMEEDLSNNDNPEIIKMMVDNLKELRNMLENIKKV